MQVNVAPASGVAKLLVRRQPLITEEDHAVLEQRGANLRQHIIRQIRGQIDAFDDRTAGTGDPMRFDVAIPGIVWSIDRRPSLPGIMTSCGRPAKAKEALRQYMC
jgi:hypothetical protein